MAARPEIVDLISSPPPTQVKLPQSSHRLPTISATQALHELKKNGPASIATGVASLDFRLADSNLNRTSSGGFERGKVTEIWGPSGTGKTALALQTAVSVICNGREGSVLWLDGATPLSGPRLARVFEDPTSRSGGVEVLQRFRHVATPNLSHLLAMVLHPRAGLLPENCPLLVVDGLNYLIDADYPRYQYSSISRTEAQKWQAGRRYAVLGSLVAGLNKLALLNNLAVIVTTGCASRMRPNSGLGAALMPSIGGNEWDSGIWSKMVLFRDFGGRFIGLQKLRGRSLISREEVGEFGQLLALDIAGNGSFCERHTNGPDVAVPKMASSPVKSRKRVFDEVADSDGDDVDEYGWAGTDEDVLAAHETGEDPGVAAEGAGEDTSL